MEFKLCVAGKTGLAIQTAKCALEFLPSDKLCILPSLSDPDFDTWQPSLKKWALKNAIHIVTLEKLYDCKELIFLSAEFDRLISPERFSSTRLYNIHFSFLPEYKGSYTAIWPILEDKRYSGVTLHEIDYGIDTGNIVDQLKVPIRQSDTARSLYDKYLDESGKLISRWLPELISGSVKSVPQPIENSSFKSRKSISFDKLRIDLKQTAHSLHNQIRAFTFREYQLPSVEGQPIIQSEILSERSVKRAGTKLHEDEERICLATIDYNVILKKDPLEQLFCACAGKNQFHLEKILTRVPDINERNGKGWTPLMVAAYHCNPLAVERLIHAGANVNDSNYKGTSVLMYAKSGALLNDGNLSCVKLLLKHGANPSHCDYSGKTVLDYAASERFDKFLAIVATETA